MNLLLCSEFLIERGVANVVFVRGCEAAGLATINRDASQREAIGLVSITIRLVNLSLLCFAGLQFPPKTN